MTKQPVIVLEGALVSLTLFGVSAILIYRSIRSTHKQQQDEIDFYTRRRKSMQELRKTTPSRGDVSNRGQTARIPPIPYLKQLFACFSDPCDPVQNPSGYIALCTAENKLVTNVLAERCMHVGIDSLSDSSVYCYNSFLGLPLAREAAAYCLARRFLHPDNPDLNPADALQLIQPKHVALAAGAAPILSNLAYMLGEAGDVCLIPAPYYAAFETDIHVVAGLLPFPIRQANPMQGPTEAELDLAYLQARSKGLNPKILLLTNPNNPLAVIYRPSVMLKSVQWARKRKLHTIVDELYALSTHDSSENPFESIIRVLDNDLGDNVHMLWGISKDFGASGLRYGILYSQNEIMLEGLATLSTFSGVSGPMQYLVSELLTDDVWLSSFLDESRRRLVNSYRICTQKLEEMVLPYIPAEAGMFVYVDFSSLLPQKSFHWERKLSEIMFQVRVVLTPGETQSDASPGMFRICYAWVEPETLEIAMERLSRLVAKLRRMDWDNLNERVVSKILYG